MAAALGGVRQRKGTRIPVGLTIKEHRHTGEPYYAVIALEEMPSGGVSILAPYDEAWQRPRKGSLSFTFLDELQASAPDLAGYTVHVTREWLAACFLEPSWEELSASPCRVLGATVGIMTGLLPPEGVPVRLGGNGSKGGRAGKGAAAGAAGAPSPGSVLRGMLPVVLLNLGILVAVWLLARWVEWRIEPGRRTDDSG